MKLTWIVVVLVLLFVAGIYIYNLNKDYSDEPRVCFNDTCFDVEVVDNQQEREIGLMNRERMELDKGMLFVFDEVGNYPFWMKNTLIPLDMIWMDEDRKVVYVKRNALPCEKDPCEIINPNANAKYVIELNSGISAQKGIAIGSIADFDI